MSEGQRWVPQAPSVGAARMPYSLLEPVPKLWGEKVMEKGTSNQHPAAVRSGAPHHPSPGICTPLSTQREQPMRQNLHLLLGAVTPFYGYKAAG